ncbi:hypothetical protein ScPMuIL_012931 [Solemya velum]
MRLAEVISVFTAVFLITFTIGDGAPQWRPQGRFGKRLDLRYPATWQSESDKALTDEFSLLPIIPDSSETDPEEEIINTMNRLCVKSSIPGLYRCYRKKRSASLLQSEDDVV